MGSNPNFTRSTSTLADEVFTKLYGSDKFKNPVGTPFVDDIPLIQQFKHELYTNAELRDLKLAEFPKTAEYNRCFTLPRTTENTEIDSILRTLAPFIRKSLEIGAVAPQIVTETGQALSLANFLQTSAALHYVPSVQGSEAYLALCRPLVFFDQQSGKPYNHATVERGILDCSAWLLAEYGLRLLPSQLPLMGGFPNVMTRYRQAPAARFTLAGEAEKGTATLVYS